MADTKHSINCPACGKEMKKVFLEEYGINVDICVDGCGGILFDNRELEKFDEKHENADKILAEIKDKDFKQIDTSQKRNCSVCNTPMVKMGANDGAVIIDVCNVCGAKFLDNGELEQIRTYIVNNKLFNQEFTAKSQNIEAIENKELYGKVGLFVQKYFPMSKGRQTTENFIKKFL